MSLTTALSSLDVKIITLVEMTGGKTYPLWTVSGTYADVYSVAETQDVVSVKFNGTALTYSRLYTVGENTWFLENNVLYIHLSSGYSPNNHDNILQAIIRHRFGNVSKNYDSHYYQGRVKSMPSLSYRVESDFLGLSQISGGTLELSNGDRFFDSLDYQWDAGTVTIRVGADTTTVMADGDYESVGVFSIVGWNMTDEVASFELAEIKERLKGSIPNTFFSKTDYPYMNDGDDGKPIPIAYGQVFGAYPVCTNSKTGEFKLSSHAIWSVDSIRIETEGGYEDVISASVDTSTATFTLNAIGEVYPWVFSSAGANTVQFYVEGVTGKFPDPNTIGYYEVILYNYTDYSDDPEADPSLVRMTVRESSVVRFQGLPANWVNWDTYVPTPAVAKTLLKATYSTEYTLPSDTTKTYKVTYRLWKGEKVSVDLHGKVKTDGHWMNNASDIVKDILSTYFSETSINTASFTAAASVLEIGYYEGDSSDKNCVRVPGIYIDSLSSGLDVINKINGVVGSYLYINRSGEYCYKVFRPARGQDCSTITQDEVTDYSETLENEARAGILRAEYAERIGEGWAQMTSVTKARNQYLANFPSNRVKEYETCLSTTTDARLFLQRHAIYEGRQRRLISFSTRWRGFLFSPSDQIRFQYERRDMDLILEVLEVTYDFTRMTVSFVCGDRRGVVCGFWVDSSETIPASLDGETGYGAGSVVWNSSWSDPLKTWTTQNIGYWMDANGYADPADGESYMVSRWL